MEESNALNKLTESVDLIRMVEDLTSPSAFEKLSASSIAGIRITLRNIKENILQSHDVFAANLVNRARSAGEVRATEVRAQQQNIQKSTTIIAPEVSTKVDSVNLLDNATNAMRTSSGATFTRRDLRASLEKLAESR